MKTFRSLYDLFAALPDERAAISYFQGIRWRNGPFCPYCGERRIYHFSDGKKHRCAACRQLFSIRVGTVLEDSKIPIRKWLAAVWLLTSNRKGIASTQLAREIGVTQRTAWFMLHRLRHALKSGGDRELLSGQVEVDETFVGGKDKNKPEHARGKPKAIVIGMLQRGGQLRARTIDSLKDARRAVLESVSPGADLMTDGWPGYRGLGKRYQHETVDHSKGEFVRDRTVHVNGIEGVWSLLKRQLLGVHHWVSHKHLERYVNEVVWRYNQRKAQEVLRLPAFLEGVSGRLRYSDLVGNR